MADNLVTGSTGASVAFDDISSVFYARMKLVHGADGVNDGDISTANPFPVRLYVGTTSLALGGGVEASALRVTIASDSTGVLSVDDNGSSLSVDDGGSTLSIDDGAGSITVDGTVSISGTVTVGSHAVTNAGTFAVQVDGNALTALQLIDDVVYVDNASFTDDASKFALIGGVYQSTPQTITDGRVAPILLDANGRIVVGTHAVTQSGTWNVGTVTTVTTVSTVTNVATIGTSVTPGTGAAHLGKAEDAGHVSGDTGVMMLGVRADTPASTGQSDGDYTAPTFDSSGRLWCNVNNTITVAAHAVTNAGVFAVQVDGTALTRLTDIKTNTDSGAVVGNGAAATAQRVTIANDSTGVLAGITTVTTVTTCSTVTTLTGSSIAHDAVDSGSPHKIGAKATASVLGATPVAAADRTDVFAGTDGVLLNRPHTSLEDIISETKTNTDGASTAMTSAFAATASQRIYLTTLILCNSSASNITVDIRDGSAGSVLITVPVPATGGAIINFPVPLRFTANTAAAFDGSAAATTLTCSMVGFKSKT